MRPGRAGHDLPPADDTPIIHGAIPPRDVLLRFIADHPEQASKREIAKAFGLKGEARVELKAPTSVIGTSTREAMQAGVVMGEVARIDGLLDLVLAELGCEAPVVVTGADADAMAALLRHGARADQTLTLRGLRRLHELNRRR